jgi:hypothetical protein
MSDRLSIAGDADDWAIFSRTRTSGKPIFFRSRAGLPHVREFAEKNFFARLRCTLDPGELTDAGLPKSTEALDSFEDALLTALAAADAETYLIAVTTGNGVRDFYFTAADRGKLPEALKSIERERPFSVALASGDPAQFLAGLTLSKEELEKASYHEVPVKPGGGGLLGKLFSR